MDGSCIHEKLQHVPQIRDARTSPSIRVPLKRVWLGFSL